MVVGVVVIDGFRGWGWNKRVLEACGARRTDRKEMTSWYIRVKAGR